MASKGPDEAFEAHWGFFPENETDFDTTTQDGRPNASTQNFELPTAHCSPPELYFACLVAELDEIKVPDFRKIDKPDPEVNFSDWVDLTDAPSASEVYTPITENDVIDPNIFGTPDLTAAKVCGFIRVYHDELMRYEGKVLEVLVRYHEELNTYQTHLGGHLAVPQSNIDQVSLTEEQNTLSQKHHIADDNEHRFDITQQSQPTRGKFVHPLAASSEYLTVPKLHTWSTEQQQSTYHHPVTPPGKLIPSTVFKPRRPSHQYLPTASKVPPLSLRRSSYTYGDSTPARHKMADSNLQKEGSPVARSLQTSSRSPVSGSATSLNRGRSQTLGPLQTSSGPPVSGSAAGLGPAGRHRIILRNTPSHPPMSGSAAGITGEVTQRLTPRQTLHGPSTSDSAIGITGEVTHGQAPRQTLCGPSTSSSAAGITGEVTQRLAPRQTLRRPLVSESTTGLTRDQRKEMPMPPPSRPDSPPPGDEGEIFGCPKGARLFLVESFSRSPSPASGSLEQVENTIPAKRKAVTVTDRVLRSRKRQATSTASLISDALAASRAKRLSTTATKTATKSTDQNRSLLEAHPPSSVPQKNRPVLTALEIQKPAADGSTPMPVEARRRFVTKCDKCLQEVFMEDLFIHMDSNCKGFIAEYEKIKRKRDPTPDPDDTSAGGKREPKMFRLRNVAPEEK